MIPTALSIDELADRLAGVVLARNMARAPAPYSDPGDRSLLLLLTGSGLVVVPSAGDAGAREMPKRKAEAEAYVRSKLGSVLA